MSEHLPLVIQFCWVWIPLFLMGVQAGWTMAWRQRDKLDAEFRRRFPRAEP